MLRSRAINTVGLVMTALVLVVVLVTKFAQGAWITLLAMGTFILIMRAIRAWGAYLCARPGRTGLRAVVARALTHTTDFFILTAAARGVLSYVDAPAALGKTVIFLFTVAAAFQGAIWMREVILVLVISAAPSAILVPISTSSLMFG